MKNSKSRGKVVMFLKPKSFKGTLMMLGTGCYAYHTGFLCEKSGYFYDMNLMRRRVKWKKVLETHPKTIFEVYYAPVVVSEEYLKQETLNDTTIYGFLDYALFTVRWLFHLVGKSTPNKNGVICSEMTANDMVRNGWESPFVEIPSPCHLRSILRSEGRLDQVVFGSKTLKGLYDPVSRKIPKLRSTKASRKSEVRK